MWAKAASGRTCVPDWSTLYTHASSAWTAWISCLCCLQAVQWVERSRNRGGHASRHGGGCARDCCRTLRPAPGAAARECGCEQLGGWGQFLRGQRLRHMIHTTDTDTRTRAHSSEWESWLGIWIWTLQIADGMVLCMYRMLQAERSANLGEFTDLLEEAGLWRPDMGRVSLSGVLAGIWHKRAHEGATAGRILVAKERTIQAFMGVDGGAVTPFLQGARAGLEHMHVPTRLQPRTHQTPPMLQHPCLSVRGIRDLCTTFAVVVLLRAPEGTPPPCRLRCSCWCYARCGECAHAVPLAYLEGRRPLTVLCASSLSAVVTGNTFACALPAGHRSDAFITMRELTRK